MLLQASQISIELGHASMGHTSVDHTLVGHTSVGHTSVGHTSVGHTSVDHALLHWAILHWIILQCVRTIHSEIVDTSLSIIHDVVSSLLLIILFSNTSIL